MNVKKGDKVKILCGFDANKNGVVTDVFHKKNKIIVSGINLKTCFLKITEQNKENFMKKEFPIDVSNVKKVD